MRIAAFLILVTSMLEADTGRRKSSFDPQNCGLVRSIFPNVGRVFGCDFSPDGGLLAVAGENGKVHLYRSGDWTSVRVLEAHPRGAGSVRFSPDGKFLATTGIDGTARIWDVAGGIALARFADHSGTVHAAAWSPDGTRVATTGADRSVRVWDPRSGESKAVLLGHNAAAYALLFTADGTQLLSGGYDGTVRLWNVAKGDLVKKLVSPEHAITALALSRDGRRLFTGSGDGENSVREWDLSTGRSVRNLRSAHTGNVLSLRLMPDERTLISAGGLTVHLWETSSLRNLAILSHHTADINAMAISPGGKWIATAGLDMQLKIWGRVPGGMKAVRTKGFLGVRVQDAGNGVEIIEVLAGTAAEAAGVQTGDVILKVGDQKVATSSESIAAIGSHWEGDEVEFTLLRNGQEVTIRAKLGKRPENR